MTAGTPEQLERGWEGAEDRGCHLGGGSGAGPGAPDRAHTSLDKRAAGAGLPATLSAALILPWSPVLPTG